MEKKEYYDGFCTRCGKTGRVFDEEVRDDDGEYLYHHTLCRQCSREINTWFKKNINPKYIKGENNVI